MDLLVVEDDPTAGELVQLVLTLHGHTVRRVMDAESALASARRSLPDVLLTDLRLAGPLDGRGLVAAVRDDVALAGIAVVVLTGQVTSDGVAEVPGADAVLGKPVDVTELVAVVQACRSPR